MTRADPTQTLDPVFPCLSPDSADPGGVPLRAMVEELTRELDMRRNAYPRRVSKGQLTRYDAERQIDLLHAIRDDIDRMLAWERWQAEVGTPAPRDLADLSRRAEAAVSRWRWSELVAELRREIALRRKYYPRWVAGGQIAEAAAKAQLERIEAVHFRYWVRMDRFMPDELWQHRAAISAADGPERRAWRSAAHAHRARFAPGSTRGEYVGEAAFATAGEPELALA